MRSENDFGYNMDQARAFASHHRTSVGSSASPYSQDMGSGGDILASYQGGQVCGQYTSKYYPVSQWSSGYPEDGVDYALNCASYPMMGHDGVQMVPGGHWAYRSKQSSGPGGVYIDAESGYYAANTTNLVHRPAATAPMNNNSATFSFSNIAASLPSGSSERLLPNPTSSRVLASSSYQGDGVPYTKGGNTGGAAQTSPISPLADVSAAAYSTSMSSGSYENSSLAAYQTTGTSLASHHNRPETIFTEQEHSIGQQGSAVDLQGYTYSDSSSGSLRRGSAVSGSTSTTSSATGSLSNGHAYVPSENLHHTHCSSYASSTSPHHHHSSQHHHHHAVGGGTGSAGYAASEVAAASGGGSGGRGTGGTGAGTRHGDGYYPSVGHRR